MPPRERTAGTPQDGRLARNRKLMREWKAEVKAELREEELARKAGDGRSNRVRKPQARDIAVRRMASIEPPPAVDPDNLRLHRSFVEDRPWMRDGNARKFDFECQLIFLNHLARFGLISDAAVKAGVSTAVIGTYAKYDKVFSAAYAEALVSYRDLVKSQVHRRGIEGTIKAKWDGGVIVGYERVYSDRLLEMEAKRVEPEYREKDTINVSATANAVIVGAPDLSGLSVAELKALRAIAVKIAPKQLEAPAQPAQSETEMRDVTPAK